MSTILVLLSLAVIMLLFSPTNHSLTLVLNNQSKEDLWITYATRNIEIKPQPKQILQGQSDRLLLTSQGFSALTAAISFYTSPSKLQKRAVIAIKAGRVIAKIDPHCHVTQTDQTATVIFE